MKNRFILGLTGPTGAGKSSIAALLKQHGFFHIDADAAARKVMAPGSPILPRLEAAFGGVLKGDGSLDRKALAKKAFDSPAATEKLNSLTHPAILKEIEKQAQEAAALGYTKLVVDAAALFESGGEKMCDKAAAVLAPPEERLKRILQRDGLTRDEALHRIHGQKDDAFYRGQADFLLETRDGIPNEPLVEELIKELKREYPSFF